MTNVTFKQGLKANLPTVAEVNTLLFTTDTGEIYKGTGSGIVSLGSVLSGFANLAAINALPYKVIGKIYLTNDKKLYSYNGTAFELLVDSDSAGKVKFNASDTLGYLETKLGSTLEIDNGVIKVKGVEGLDLTGSEVQALLNNATGNIQDQINSIVTGISFLGSVNGVAGLATLTPENGSLAVVNNSGEASELHIYSAATTSWQKIGKFEFSESFIGLKDTPSAYVAGKVLKSSASGVILGDIDYSDLTGKPDAEIAKIEEAVEKIHEHSNLSLLELITDDGDGNLLYNGVKIGTQWETFEF